mgnify:FL=1
MTEDDDDDPQMVIVCAGPPRCDLNGDEAYEAQRAGCIWCRRIACHADGSEIETGPGNA